MTQASPFDNSDFIAPRDYSKLRRRGTGKEAAEITEEDRAIAAMLEPQQSKFFLRQPRRANERHDALIAAMSERYPDADPEAMLKKARTARGRVRAASGLVKHHEKVEYEEPEKTLRKLHSRQPNVIYKPRYLPLLDKYQGEPTFDEVSEEHKGWRFGTPQTLPDSEYNAMARNFAEMVGVAQLRPTYDRRLLTEESAKAAFGDRAKQYTYRLEDMDNDPNTPGTLLIRDKNNRLIAVGGYRLPKASAGQTEALLKDIHYYDENPTAEARRAMSRREFQALKKNEMFYPKAPAKLLGPVVQKVNDLFQRLNINAPARGQRCYIKLVPKKPEEKEKIIYYSVSPIAWNGIMKYIAKLYLYYYIFPIIKKVQLPPDTPASQALEIIQALARGDIVEKLDHPDTAAVKNAENKLTIKLNEIWKSETLFQPRLEIAILKDAQVQDLIKGYLNSQGIQPERVQNLLTVVVIQMCRINLNVISQLFNYSPTASPAHQLLKWLIESIQRFEFVKSAEIPAVEADINTQHRLVLPLTTLSESALQEEHSVSYVDDSQYVEPVEASSSSTTTSSSSSSSSSSSAPRYRALR